MKKPPIPPNELERLKELNSFKLFDNLPDEDLDLITKLASDICGTKVSLVTLIDAKHQLFKSKYGIELDHTSRDVAFCAHAINDPDKMLIVNDAREDERFKNNPLVTGQPNIAFYAGMPISSKGGYALGTLCVIDSKPKVLSTSQINALKSLSKLVQKLFESRKQALELEQTKEQLDLHKSQADEIAYSIAHDLKNPLDSIQGFLELLQHESATKLGKEAMEYINYAKQSTQKMTGLIYEILAFAKLSNTTIEKEMVEVEPIIQNIIDLNLPIIKSENISLKYKDLPNVRTSKLLFSVILRNLVGNAIKFRSPERNLVITIDVKESNNDWTVSVSDNGIGIQEQSLTKIFRPFYKEDKSKTDGVGMGLATCKKAVLNLEGNFDVKSEYGKGSCFSFTIPK
ncbi:GAF domain-containing sensor histidine kinase [Psychroflexus tropicus]|uniref:GAF domain-containing sensor histidine kinase n=1 Tax=Psychroflexus tropicus TaxID=197345 RepID=UPI0003666A9D|nr:GAF domain-containing sensor histidine kinase [Psychroflexus tropicus]